MSKIATCTPEEVNAYQVIIASHRQRIRNHTIEWRLGGSQQQMLELLLRQASEAEAAGNYEKAISILVSICSALNIKEGIEDRRTKGASVGYKRVHASGQPTP